MAKNCDRLELRLDKCRFLYEKIEFLGCVISKEGVRSSDYGNAVKNFPTPKNVRCAKFSWFKLVF